MSKCPVLHFIFNMVSVQTECPYLCGSSQQYYTREKSRANSFSLLQSFGHWSDQLQIWLMSSFWGLN
jgi:hypothetical protein